MNFENLQRLAEEEVRATMEDLPPEVRGAVEAVPVFFEKTPDQEDVSLGIAPDTLGLFDDGGTDVPMPRIRLWLENLWDFSEKDEEIFLEEVHTTFLHEIGHFLGWSEEEIDERGLG